MKFLLWAVVSLLALVGLWTVQGQVRHWRGPSRRRRVDDPPASVLVLVRDQAEALEGFLRHLLSPEAFGWDPPLRYEVVAIDTGSRDDSPAILQRMAQQHPALHVHVLEGPESDPVTHGLRWCPHPVVLLFDLRSPRRTRAAFRALRVLWGAERVAERDVDDPHVAKYGI